MCGSAVMVSVVVLRVVSHWSLVPIPCPRVGASCVCQVSRVMTAGCVGGRSVTEAAIILAEEIQGSGCLVRGCSRSASSLFRGASEFEVSRLAQCLG
jgi:hypothetical protein